MEKKINKFNIVELFMVIPGEGYVSLQPRKESECAAIRSSSFFSKSRVKYRVRMEWN
jgi:hypothetical protein